MTPEDSIRAARASGRSSLDELAGKRLLSQFGIAVPSSVMLAPGEPAAPKIVGLQAPFVVKVMSPEILHKSDAGGVRVRLRDAHEVDAAIRAVAGLPNERLVIVGDGPQRAELSAMLPDNVRLVSGISDEHLRWLYARSRALIAPSHEDFGLTVIEAAAWGKPSIALRAGGYLDTVREGATGRFFDVPTAAAIADAVVFGLPAAGVGSLVAAMLEPAPGSPTLTAGSLRDIMSARLGPAHGDRSRRAVHAVEVDLRHEVGLGADLPGEAVVRLEPDHRAGLDLQHGLEIGPERPDHVVPTDAMLRGDGHQPAAATVSSST